MEIEVAYVSRGIDALGNSVKKSIEEDLGIKGIESVSCVEGYSINAGLSAAEAETVASGLLADPITQKYSVGKPADSGFDWEIAVRYHSDVTDNIGDEAAAAISELLGREIPHGAVRTTRKYLVKGKVSESDVKRVCTEMLANELIESFEYRRSVKGK